MPIASSKNVFAAESKPKETPMAIKKAAPKKAPKKGASREDIKITCMVETPDGSVYEKEVSIVNPTGCISVAYVNQPDTVFNLLTEGLIGKLGVNHVK